MDQQHTEKAGANHIEGGLKGVENGGVFDAKDQFGAHRKVDPAEIALVRKLDWYIMVSSDLVVVSRLTPDSSHRFGLLTSSTTSIAMRLLTPD